MKNYVTFVTLLVLALTFLVPVSVSMVSAKQPDQTTSPVTFGSTVALTSGVSSYQSLTTTTTGKYDDFYITISSTPTSVVAVLDSVGTDDFDLYYKYGSTASSSSYNLRAYTSSADETITLTSTYLKTGTHYFRVQRYGGTGTDYYYMTVTAVTGGGSSDTTAPTVSITTPAASATVSGTTSITFSATDNVGVTSTAILIDGTTVSTASSYSWATTSYTDGSHTVKVTATDAAGNVGSDTHTVTVSNGGGSTAEKIAVFFWASDAGAQWVIDEYTTVLTNEGYTKFFSFKDTSNFATAFATVDAYEQAGDIIFFYLFGHGANNGVDSYTAFAPSASIVYSSTFRTLMDGLETTYKGFLIESCDSGGWPEDFQASPYIAMSTSDQTHYSYAMGSLPNEGIFSHYFFNHVAAGYNAASSFTYAKSYTTTQYPLISNYAVYDFFAD